jgi:hypothetical protein
LNNVLSLYLRNSVSNYHLEFVQCDLPAASILLFSHGEGSVYVYNRVLYYHLDISISIHANNVYKLYIIHSDVQ